MSGYPMFVAGVVIFAGVIGQLWKRLGEDADWRLALLPFSHLMTYSMMIIMALALLFTGAMTTRR